VYWADAEGQTVGFTLGKQKLSDLRWGAGRGLHICALVGAIKAPGEEKNAKGSASAKIRTRNTKKTRAKDRWVCEHKFPAEMLALIVSGTLSGNRLRKIGNSLGRMQPAKSPTADTRTIARYNCCCTENPREGGNAV